VSVLTVDVVMETYCAAGFTAWPTGPSGGRFLALSGQMPGADVGTAMAVIFTYNNIGAEPAVGLDAALLDRHVAETGALTAPGGLRFRDTATNTEVVPGCCVGLERWRDWHGVLRGEEPWLGHSPAPWLERSGGILRLGQDEDDRDASPATVQISVADLPRLLAGAQHQLRGFLGIVPHWAAQVVPQLSAGLVAALDDQFAINHPPRLRGDRRLG